MHQRTAHNKTIERKKSDLIKCQIRNTLVELWLSGALLVTTYLYTYTLYKMQDTHTHEKQRFVARLDRPVAEESVCKNACTQLHNDGRIVQT